MFLNSQQTSFFLEVCHLIYQRKLVSGSGGNVSIRCDKDSFLITPSGLSLSVLQAEDLVLVHSDGSYQARDGLIPSKEWKMHLACYHRADVNAVMHIHSTHAVAVSCLTQTNPACAIPSYTPGYELRVGSLPMVPYARPGSVELAEQITAIIARRNSVLLANHGVLTVGSSLANALNVAEEIEEEAQIHLLVAGQGQALSAEQRAPLAPHGMCQ